MWLAAERFCSVLGEPLRFPAEVRLRWQEGQAGKWIHGGFSAFIAHGFRAEIAEKAEK